MHAENILCAFVTEVASVKASGSTSREEQPLNIQDVSSTPSVIVKPEGNVRMEVSSNKAPACLTEAGNLKSSGITEIFVQFRKSARTDSVPSGMNT